MSENKEIDIKPRSREVTDGANRAPARAMLRAVGMKEEDFSKAQVGVASSWNEVTPCNLPLDIMTFSISSVIKLISPNNSIIICWF